MREGQPPVTVLSAAPDRPHSYEWKAFDIFIMVNIMIMVMTVMMVMMTMKVGGEQVDRIWFYNTNTYVENAELKTTSDSLIGKACWLMSNHTCK